MRLKESNISLNALRPIKIVFSQNILGFHGAYNKATLQSKCVNKTISLMCLVLGLEKIVRAQFEDRMDVEYGIWTESHRTKSHNMKSIQNRTI